MCHLGVEIKRLSKDAEIPVYRREGDAGFDLASTSEIKVMPDERRMISTGLAFAIPQGFEMQIRLRSSAALSTPLIIPNAPGTVDSGYRGEVRIVVLNTSKFPYTIEKGERVAQGVICPVARAAFIEVEDLPASDRGCGGFGSTDTVK